MEGLEPFKDQEILASNSLQINVKYRLENSSQPNFYFLIFRKKRERIAMHDAT